MARRVTTHNGRKGKNGVYNPNHNDRNFTTESDHIDSEKSSQNFYWMHDKSCSSFEECEAKFYAENFQKGLQKINAKHEASRNYKRVKTMDDYRASSRTCPEESLYYIGDRKQPIDRKLFQKIVLEQVSWEMRTFPNVKVLDIALHVDEEGAEHLHERRVWIAHDEDGNLIVNQKKALEEMGIKAPDASKKEGRYNNAKVTYTKMVRDHFMELCRSYGIEIIDEPRDKSKSGLSLDAYKAERMKEEAKTEAEKIVSDAREQAEQLLADVTKRERAVFERETAVSVREQKQQEQADRFQRWEDALDAQRKALEASQEALNVDRQNFTAKVHKEAVRLSNEWQEQAERQAQEQAKPARALPFGGSFDY